MSKQVENEKIVFWKSNHLEGLDCLHAKYIDHTFSKHAHSGFAIGVIESGIEGFLYRGENQFGLKNSLVVLNPEEVHTGYAAEKEGWTYRMIYPEKSLIQKMLGIENAEDLSQIFFKESVIDNAEMASLFLKLHDTLEYSDSALEQRTEFIYFFDKLLKRYASKSLSHIKDDALPHKEIQRAVDYMQAYFDEDISLLELAQVTHLSEYHFARMFKRQYGLSPHAYLNQIRVRKAKEYLAHGLAIPKAAAEVGFVDQSHLLRRFKKVFGITPGQYQAASKNVQYKTRDHPL
ncbi:AraC family transcriptional regulator [Sporolactobacillus shoreicorticis]|uniref:Helix-turn-helix domain-containing protein n=1 Tax=Sporolactobacillus shoreicorticis TaxID=1923877 RepID=A0ABW5S1T5_9BACL|nr:AraC family transcriptional regulator [Sporolactobacillus shoreicorticis]MCO7126461.1 AraC family transcriptional regulator [Sporolactobacillus shoreicorticis]